MASRSCTFLEILIAILLPPLGVFLHYGCCSVSHNPQPLLDHPLTPPDLGSTIRRFRTPIEQRAAAVTVG
jgi:hypothetical protein